MGLAVEFGGGKEIVQGNWGAVAPLNLSSTPGLTIEVVHLARVLLLVLSLLALTHYLLSFHIHCTATI